MSVETKYILGTEGQPDYIVISEKDGLRLGVKGFTVPGFGGTIMMILRVRTQRTDGKAAGDGKLFVNSWPLPFEKINPKRASVEVVQFVNRSHFQFNDVIEGAESARFASKAFDYFEEAGIKMDVSRNDFRDHLHKQWFEEVAEILNDEDPKFLLSTFATVANIKNAMQDGGLTIGVKTVTVNGEEKPWPVADQTAKKPVRKKAIAGDGEDATDNVVKLPVKSKAKAAKKKKPPTG